jgi:hypothetical protein
MTDDFGMNDLDFDFLGDGPKSSKNISSKKSKNREAVDEVFKGTFEGVKGSFADGKAVKKIIQSSLPKSYEVAFKTADDLTDGLGDLYDDSVRKLRPQANSLAKKIDKLVPNEQKFLKKLTSKFVEATNDGGNSFSGANSEKFQEEAINSTLSAIFQQQQDNNLRIKAVEMAKDDVKTQIEANRYKNSMLIMGQMNENIARMSRYNETVGQAYQRKSLEVQLRSFYVQKAMFEQSKQFHEIAIKQLEGIVRNSALPDFVKVKKSEEFMQFGKKKLYESAYGYFQNNVAANFNKNIKTYMKNLVAGLKDSLESMDNMADSALSAKEALDSQDDMDFGDFGIEVDKMSGKRMAGQFVGQYIGDWIKDKTAGRIRKHLSEKNNPVAKYGYKVNSKFKNLGGTIGDARRSKQMSKLLYSDNKLVSMFGELAYDFLGMFGTNKTNDTRLLSKGGMNGSSSDPAVYNNKAQLSITEVIPGYLARILREQIIARTGNDRTDLYVYDFKRGTFSTSKRQTAIVRKELSNVFKRSYHKEQTEDTKKSLLGADSEKRFSQEEHTAINKLIVDLSSLHNISYTPKNIKNTKSFKSLSPELQEKLSGILESRFEKSEDKNKNESDLTDEFMKLKEFTPDIRHYIEQALEEGHGKSLLADGLIKRGKNGELLISEKKIMEMLHSNVARSDINVKKSIREFKPSEALKAVRKTKIYNWLYKNPRSPQEDGEKIGGMAQDIKTNFGKDVSDGKKIDLVSMNGANMSAIKELSDRQDKQEKSVNSDSSIEILKQLLEQTSKNNDILNKHFQLSKIAILGDDNGSELGDFAKGLNLNNIKDVAILQKRLLKVRLDDKFKQAKDAFDKYAILGRRRGRQLRSKAKQKYQDGKEFYQDMKDKYGDDVKEGLFKAYTFSKEAAKKTFDITKDLLSNKAPAFLGNLKKDLGKGLQFLGDLITQTDIYVKGETEPRIRVNLLNNGYYYDRESGKPIARFSDIKGPIVDRDGNLVLDHEDIKKGLVDRHGNPALGTLARLISKTGGFLKGSHDIGLKLAKEFSSLAKTMGAGLWGELKKGFSNIRDYGFGVGIGGKKTYDILVEIRDILSKKSQYSGDNAQNNGVDINVDDLNNPTPNPSGTKSKGLFDKLEQRARIFKKRFARKGKKGQIGDIAQSNTTENKTKPNVDVDLDKMEFMAKRKANEEQEKSKSSNKDTIKDQANKSNLSTMPARREQKKQLDADMTVKYKDGEGIFGMLGGVLGKLSSFITTGAEFLGLAGKGGILKTLGSVLLGGIGNLFKGAAALIPGGGVLSTVARGAVGLAGGLTTGVLGAAGSVIGAVSSASVALLANPITIGAIAVAGTAYLGYKAYKHFSNKRMNEKVQLRLLQYGFNDSELHRSKWGDIVELEQYLIDNLLTYDGTKAIFKSSLSKEMKSLWEIFSIDPKDEEMTKRFKIWFERRFAPFFLSGQTAAKIVDPKVDITNWDSKLSFADSARYLELSRYESGPYGEETSPFKDIPSLDNTKDLFSPLFEKVLKEQTDNIVGKPSSKYDKLKDDQKKEDNTIGKVKPDTYRPPISVQENRQQNTGQPNVVTEDVKEPRPGSINSSVSGSKLAFANGPLRDGSLGMQYIAVKDGVDLRNVNPSLLKNFMAMAQEYGELTGKKLVVEDAKRTTAEQAALYAKDPLKAAKPGRSLHEFGLALDVSSGGLEEAEKLGLMRKYGFTRPVGKEPWHIEPGALQGFQAKAIADNVWATQAIAMSPGLGGGGPGIDPAYSLGQRDPDLGRKLREAGNSPNINNDKTDNLPQNAGGVGSRQQSQNSPVASSANNTPDNKLVMREDPSRSQTTSSTTISSSTPGGQASTIGGDLNAIIEDSAKKAGVSSSTLKAFAAVESDMNPDAKSSSSSARGLMQFTNATWLEQIGKNGRKYGLDETCSPYDPKAACLMGAEYIKENTKGLQSVKTNVTTTDLYLSHLLGLGGARQILNANPSELAAKILPTAAASNQNLFYKAGKALTVSEFYANINQIVSSKAARYGIKVNGDKLPNKTSGPSGGSETQYSPDGYVVGGSVIPDAPAKTNNNPYQLPTNRPRERQGIFDLAPKPMTVIKSPPSETPNTTSTRVVDNSNTDKVLETGFGDMGKTMNTSVSIQQQMLDVLVSIAKSTTTTQRISPTGPSVSQGTTTQKIAGIDRPTLDLQRGATVGVRG